MKNISEYFKNGPYYFKNGPQWAQIMFWVLMIIGVTMLIIGFYLPPVGEISKSAILTFGEVQTFASIGVAFAAIFKGMNVKIQKGDTTIEANGDKKDNEE